MRKREKKKGTADLSARRGERKKTMLIYVIYSITVAKNWGPVGITTDKTQAEKAVEEIKAKISKEADKERVYYLPFYLDGLANYKEVVYVV